MSDHRNSRPISRIDHLDLTKRLDLRGGFKTDSGKHFKYSQVSSSQGSNLQISISSSKNPGTYFCRLYPNMKNKIKLIIILINLKLFKKLKAISFKNYLTITIILYYFLFSIDFA